MADKGIHQLDLANKNLELESIFTSVINKIPDLCMPPSYRLAGEDDYVDQTKTIKLKPFRKQRAFKTSVSPEPSKMSADIRILELPPKGEQNWFIKPSAFRRTTKVTFETRQSFMHQQFSQLKNLEATKGHLKYSFTTYEKGRLKELKRKRELREKVKKKYSRVKLKQSDKDIDDHRAGFDKLFSKKPDASYPFANPMPECMMTNDNIDNLREIIVSSLDIEWKMLTPVRPDSDYEEKYFDKLIELHRNRHKSRIETGYYSSNHKLPFKHIRHTYIVHYDAVQRKQKRKDLQLAESRTRKSSNLRYGLSTIAGLKVNVPKLTISSEEKPNQPLLARDSIARENNEHDDEALEENYDKFSGRNSNRRNVTKNRNQQGKSEKESTSKQRKSLLSEQSIDNELLEDRVEEIMNQLMSSLSF